MVNNALEQHLKVVEDGADGRASVAFFDLDRTLIAGYSIVAMAWERIRQGVSRGELRESMKILRDVLRQRSDTKGGQSGDSYQRLVRRLTKSLEGVPEDSLRLLGEQAYHNTIAKGLSGVFHGDLPKSNALHPSHIDLTVHPFGCHGIVGESEEVGINEHNLRHKPP